MTKLKELKQVSQGKIDFFKYVKTMHTYLLNQNEMVDYLKILVKNPTTDFDEKEILRVIKKSSFKESRLKALIF